MDAREWFNQFDLADPPGFEEQHPGWCRRHYTPGIRLHLDGTQASMQLTTAVIGLIRSLPDGRDLTARQITDQLRELGTAWCCIAGDIMVRRIWAKQAAPV